MRLEDTGAFFMICAMKQFILLCSILLLLPAQAQAASPEEIHDQAQRLDLAHHPTWLKLLHYERDDKQSVVLTDDFFLSPEGRRDPKAELTATIHAYFAPWGENSDEQARCRFPARYFWLSQHLPLPDYYLREPKCTRLEKWALFSSVKSISLFLVSGYFGNPASTFGHALLKLNTDSTDDQYGLFDLTLNYGALVPENENVLRYIAKGIFGGYVAGFSDRYFYTEDIVYSRTEFRDIWDYRLALSDDQRTLLIFHIWEIVGKKFDYYFLNKNCAYRLAELVDMVIEEDLLDNLHPWYFPVELFHSLNDIDRDRHAHNRLRLIQSVRYIPSSRRKLYHQLKLLSPQELEVFNAIVLSGANAMSIHLEKLTVGQKISVLDSLLAYQQYRLIAEGPDSGRNRREVKDQILLARLRLPPRRRPPLAIQDRPSPAEGSRPMELGVGIASESNEDIFLRLHWSPFKKESVGQNRLEGNELVLFNLSVGISENKNKVFFDEFDLIRVLNLSTLPVKVVDEGHWSWKLRIGTDRIKKNGRDYYDGVASFGVGHAWKWNKAITAYGMVDLAAHTIDPYVRLRPHVNLRCDLGAMRAWLYFGAESVAYDAEFRDVWGGKMQYQVNDRYAIHAEFSNADATRASVGLNRYF